MLLVAGFATGAFTIAHIFAINIDLLGVPYSNSPVVAPSDIVVKQGDIKLIIPKGATLMYRYSAKETPYYVLHIVGWPFEEQPFINANTWSYFSIENDGNN